MDWDIFSFSARNLYHQKFRTALTLLGIIIGISMIIAMLSIGTGLRIYADEMFSKMGKNKIIIMPSGMAGMMFNEKDVRKVEGVRGVAAVMPVDSKSYPVIFRKETKIVTLTAVRPRDAKTVMADVQGLAINGRWMEDNERGSIVVGWNFQDKLFSKKAGLRDDVEISGKKFKIVGIFEKQGNPQDDNQVMINIEEFWDTFQNRGEIFELIVKVDSSESAQTVAERIKKELEKTREKDTFNVMTADSILKQIGSFTTVLNIILGGIAAVSLVVGGIGIMNTMMMSVVERTREIGIMKAIGATRKQIMSIFLVEAGIIGLVGGVIGLGVGYGISRLVALAGDMYGIPLKTAVTSDIAIGSLVFALLVGCLSGLYPAYRAAKLNPVEALRYE